MLQALKRLFQGRVATQLELGFDAPPPHTAEELLERLRQYGLRRFDRCKLTHNRNVMVSFGGGELRVHEGYLAAPEAVHRAIVTFVEGRTHAERREAQRVVIGFPIRTTTGTPRRERTHEDDATFEARLREWHGSYNEQHFGGALRDVELRVSRRMKTRLGHYTAASHPGDRAEIAISRRHLRRHGWDEALHTLLHEMVHQWQDESGHAIDHGATFRACARRVGVEPFARRVLGAHPGRGEQAVSVGRRAARSG